MTTISDHTWLSGALAIAALFGLYVAYQQLLSPLARVPGPFAASLSPLWLTQLSWRGGTHRVMIDLHAKYGKVVRIGPNEVSIADPDSVRTIYGAGTKFRKSNWYSVWQGTRKFDLFPERNEKIHAEQRRLVSQSYSMKSLLGLESRVDVAFAVFFQQMDQRLNEVLDLGKWLQLLAFDVIGEITFSKRFGFLDVGDDSGTFGQISMALRSAAWIGQVPWLYWLHYYLSPVVGNHLAIAARHGKLRTFAVREVEARNDRGSDSSDILSNLYAVHQQKPDQFNETAIISMASSNIFAGSDTTAISMRAVIYYVLKNEDCKKRLIAEIDESAKKGKLSDPVKYSEAEQMPYLQAVIYEALRMHPAVGMSLPRIVPHDGFDACGYHFSAGTVVGTNPWVIHRDRDVFGLDADSFNPDRWLKGDTGDMHRFFFAFGAGARICLGKNIGWMEMSKLIPTLLLRYNVRLAHPDRPWTMVSWWFVMQKGIDVILTRRTQPRE